MTTTHSSLKEGENMQRILSYLKDGISSRTLETIGGEFETQMVSGRGSPITTEQSQRIMKLLLLSQCGWSISGTKGDLVTELTDGHGNRLSFELGRHNFEIATSPMSETLLIPHAQSLLDQLYETAAHIGARPHFGPTLNTREDLLIVPDERDATWIRLDGRKALKPLATISSVQFTFAVSTVDAVLIMNKLGEQLGTFLQDYPQDAIWRRYIAESQAGYRSDRYGGPLRFGSMDDYVRNLALHDVVDGAHLVPLSECTDVDVTLHLRSIWWHFRLKRYGDALCIEVRPIPRRRDEDLEQQLQTVLDIVS